MHGLPPPRYAEAPPVGSFSGRDSSVETRVTGQTYGRAAASRGDRRLWLGHAWRALLGRQSHSQRRVRKASREGLARVHASIRMTCCMVACLTAFATQALGADLPEYRLKAAFLYNFVAFTEWPGDVGDTINLCVQGVDPFGKELDSLEGKVSSGRALRVHRLALNESMSRCQVVFVAASAKRDLPHLLEALRGQPVLTIADSPGAAEQGVALNMAASDGRVTFEANIQATRRVGIKLSSKLLRLATEVLQ